MNRTLCFITPAPGESPTELNRMLREGVGPFMNLPVLPTLAPAWLGHTVPLVEASGSDLFFIQNMARDIDRVMADLTAQAGSTAAAFEAIEAITTFVGGMGAALDESKHRIKPALKRMAEAAASLAAGKISQSEAKLVQVSVQTELTSILRPVLAGQYGQRAPVMAYFIDRRVVWVVQTTAAQGSVFRNSLMPALRSAEIYFKTAITPLAAGWAKGVGVVFDGIDLASIGFKAVSAKTWDGYFDALGVGSFGAMGSGLAVHFVLLLPLTGPVGATVALGLGGLAAVLGQETGKLIWSEYKESVTRVSKNWALP